MRSALCPKGIVFDKVELEVCLLGFDAGLFLAKDCCLGISIQVSWVEGSKKGLGAFVAEVYHANM